MAVNKIFAEKLKESSPPEHRGLDKTGLFPSVIELFQDQVGVGRYYASKLPYLGHYQFEHGLIGFGLNDRNDILLAAGEVGAFDTRQPPQGSGHAALLPCLRTNLQICPGHWFSPPFIIYIVGLGRP